MKNTKMHKAMVFTSLRTNRKTHKVHLRNMSLTTLTDMIRRESKRNQLDKFRSMMPFLEELSGKIEFNMQRISVAASFRKDGADGWCFAAYRPAASASGKFFPVTTQIASLK